jgi:hypothetical protein
VRYVEYQRLDRISSSFMVKSFGPSRDFHDHCLATVELATPASIFVAQNLLA